MSYTDCITSSPNNIAFLNDTCKNVSNGIRKLEYRDGEYCVGAFLVCREYTTTYTSVFNVNFIYKIVYFDGEVMTLKNVKAEMLQSSHIDKMRKDEKSIYSLLPALLILCKVHQLMLK